MLPLPRYSVVLVGRDADQAAHINEHHFNSSDCLSSSQRQFLEAQWKQFRNWWSNWPGREDA